MAVLTATHFRVQNYRNIDDSDWVELAQVTAFVGRNESGKTALLKALHKFNPATPLPYVPQREFPRDRYTRDYKDGKEWPVCSVRFTIDGKTRESLKKMIGGTEPPERIVYTRYYNGDLRPVLEPAVQEAQPTFSSVIAALEKFKQSAMKLTHPTPDTEATYLAIRTDLLNWITEWGDKLDAATLLKSPAGQQQLKELRENSNSKVREEVAPILTALQTELGGLAKQAVAAPIEAQIEAQLKPHLPVFVYFDNYGVLDSAVYLPRFIEDLAKDAGNSRIRTINAMFKHVNLTAEEISTLGISAVQEAQRNNQPVSPELIAQDQQRMELRSIKLSSASVDITTRFSDWWKQRRHVINYDADGDFFRIWVSDEKRPGVPIELESRSAGFQWFFSFYLVFLVESEEGHKNSILLLDEPGLHLHPTAQQELIAFFEELSKKNQLVYSTHSPFLIDGEHIERVRPVKEDATGHSQISNDAWPEDRETIFPLQAAAGYAMVRGLFQHRKNVLVEGMSEYFYLHSLSIACRAAGRAGLPEDVYVTPCGGTKLVGNLASLFLGQKVRPLILLDADDAGRVRRSALMKELYVGHDKAVLLLDAVTGLEECEIEDVVGETLFMPMVSKIIGKPIALTDVERGKRSLPDQVQLAAKRLGIDLPVGWKAEVARQFAIEWGTAATLPPDLIERGSKLLAMITERLNSLHPAVNQAKA